VTKAISTCQLEQESVMSTAYISIKALNRGAVVDESLMVLHNNSNHTSQNCDKTGLNDENV
jgi:hypothetical protein